MNENKIKSFKILGKLGLGIFFKILALIVGLLSMRWINSNLRPEELKSLFLSLFFTSAILTISTFGIGNLMTRSYVTEKTNLNNFYKLWSNYFYIQFFNFLIGGIVLYLVSLSNSLLPLIPLMLLYLSQYFLAIDGSYKSIADANNRTWTFTITETISKILIIIGLYYVVNNYFVNDKLISYCVVVVIFAFGQYLLDYFINYSEIKWTKPDLQILKDHKKEIIQFTILTTISVLSANSDKWFLNFFNFSNEVINGYSNIYNLFVIGISVESFILPVLFFNMIKDYDINSRISDIVRGNKWFYLFFVESALFTTCFYFASFYLIRFVDKDLKYAQFSYDVIPILSLAIIFNTFIFLLSQFYIFKKKLKYETISQIASSVLTIIMYIILIPILGHIGAAYSTLFGAIIHFVIKLYFVPKIN